MENELEYRIGGLQINSDKLKDSNNIAHKYIIQKTSNVLSIYIAEKEYHIEVAKKFGLAEKTVIGGGSLYHLGLFPTLVLSNYSRHFGISPKKVVQKLAELIIPELKKQGIEIKRVHVESEFGINEFWKEKGFTKIEDILEITKG